MVVSLTAGVALSGCGYAPDAPGFAQESVETASVADAPKLPTWADPGPNPRLTVEAATEPADARVGDHLVLHVHIRNLSNTDIPGVYVDLGGDWTTTLLVGIRPNGRFRDDPSGRYIVSALRIPPGENRLLDLETIPRQSGGSLLTFSVRALTSAELSRLSS